MLMLKIKSFTLKTSDIGLLLSFRLPLPDMDKDKPNARIDANQMNSHVNCANEQKQTPYISEYLSACFKIDLR